MAFGLNQFNKPTPQWAKTVFGVITLLISVAIFMVSDYPGMGEMTKTLLMKWFAGINMLSFGLAKMFGVSDNNQNPNSGE